MSSPDPDCYTYVKMPISSILGKTKTATGEFSEYKTYVTSEYYNELAKKHDALVDENNDLRKKLKNSRRQQSMQSILNKVVKIQTDTLSFMKENQNVTKCDKRD